MSSRRRRRGRRVRPLDHPEPPRDGQREAPRKPDFRRRAEFEARQARIRRARSFVGLAGFVPLGLVLLCRSGVAAFCAVAPELYLGIWAAIVGTFIGLTVRMWRERRAFQRAQAAGA